VHSMRIADRRVIGVIGCTGYDLGVNEPPADEPQPPDSRRGALIGLGLLVLLIVGGLLLARQLRGTAQMQDCLMSGRSNCAPIDAASPDSR
jgi:hypothetical protein